MQLTVEEKDLSNLNDKLFQLVPSPFYFDLCMTLQAAAWALERGTSVVIANGTGSDYVIREVLDGRKVGTFFTMVDEPGPSVENQAAAGTSECTSVMSSSFCCSPYHDWFENESSRLIRKRVILDRNLIVIFFMFKILAEYEL